jgi:poly(A) polymerase
MAPFERQFDVTKVREKLDPTPCEIVRELVRAGYEAYIVGGAIRDILIGATPKDYDISTSATPEQVKKVFGHRRCHVIGRRFRLAHVYSEGQLYEVSTFRRRPNVIERRGKYSSDGVMIWNDNCFGTLEDDAGRRDFTVNALYFDVVGKQGIIDLHNGLDDIRKRIVRAIGNPAERMDEDPVRMLRALKLVAKGGFELTPALRSVIRDHAAKIQLASPARLFEELLKIFNHHAADKTFDVMHQYGFLKYYWPTLDEAWEEPLGEFVRDMLRLRGEAMQNGIYSNSRALALSTVALPFMMLGLHPDEPNKLWHGNIRYDDVAIRVVDLLFENFRLPHLLGERVLTILEIVPKLFEQPVPTRALADNEYRYARSVALLLCRHFGWDTKPIEELPDGYTSRSDKEEIDYHQPPFSAQELLRQRQENRVEIHPSQPIEAATQASDDDNTITFAPNASALTSSEQEEEDPRTRAKRLRRRRRREHKKHLNAIAKGLIPPDDPPSSEDNDNTLDP